MLFKLIDHTWKMFRRSEYFGRSMFAIVLIIFITFFIISQLVLVGRMLPGLLQENFPQKSPAEWVYGFLLIIMLADLGFRIGFQKLPSKQIAPYLHLPVKHSLLSIYQIIRSWIHPFNIYLLFFFWPFIKLTINPAHSSQVAGLVGIAMLMAINQGLVMALKNLRFNKKSIPFYATAVILCAVLLIFFFPINWAALGLSLFLAMVNIKPTAFISLTLLIILSHVWAYFQIKYKLHYTLDQDGNSLADNGLSGWERILASIPVFGPYWVLEWQLVTRNKRSKINFWIMIPIALALAFFVGIRPPTEPETFIVIIFMIAGGYGNLHFQYALSWESHFFDFLATRNIDMKKFIQAKFNFYLAYSFLQLLIVLPILFWFNVDLAILFTGLFFYSTGFGYFFYLRIGILNPSRIDANGSASFNMEGITGARFLQIFVMLMSIFPFMIIGLIVPYPHLTSILFAITGVLFIITQNLWTRYLAAKLESRKYTNLNLYREK